MASYHSQFLYTVDALGCPAELINGARLMANMATSGDPRFSDVKLDCGCPSLLLEPAKTTITPPLTVTTVAWGPLDVSMAAAPWVRSGVPASLEAYGFYITDWTGLDGAHHGRSQLAAGAGRGGSYFGPLLERGRVWKLNVRVFGSSERGLNYLMHWLEGELLGCCSSSGTGSVWIREHCPASSVADPEEGMARADRVALLEGPTWEDPGMEEAGCFMRTVSFSLGVGDPCLYRPVGSTAVTSTVATSTATAIAATLPAQFDGPGVYGTLPYTQTGCGTFTGTAASVCLVLPRATVGRMSAVITISSPAEQSGFELATMPDLRIVGHVDRAGVGTCTPCMNTQRSLLILRGMLGGDIIEADLGRRTLRRKGSWSAGEWEDASYMMVPTSPLRPWAAFDACDAAAITVEPASVDQFSQTPSPLVSGWTVDIRSQEHFGCRC